jgi:hypothetical protein
VIACGLHLFLLLKTLLRVKECSFVYPVLRNPHLAKYLFPVHHLEPFLSIPLPLPTPPVTAPGRARVDRRLSLLAFPGERGRLTAPATSPGCGSACIVTFNLPSTPRLQHASTDLSESAAQTKAAYTSYSPNPK